ncbi:hypothetical protein M153_900003562 [Pseudoloma neurophilia]|uniref:Uncharacterized protein n=1 Tax=Pseudoloma neurophilia TaxID=146866 RepID=A0A0R0M061_9MICR|nr:hypothetical protein M153_900003562 [Pseudoloma neurophilia]
MEICKMIFLLSIVLTSGLRKSRLNSRNLYSPKQKKCHQRYQESSSMSSETMSSRFVSKHQKNEENLSKPDANMDIHSDNAVPDMAVHSNLAVHSDMFVNSTLPVHSAGLLNSTAPVHSAAPIHSDDSSFSSQSDHQNFEHSRFSGQKSKSAVEPNLLLQRFLDQCSPEIQNYNQNSFKDKISITSDDLTIPEIDDLANEDCDKHIVLRDPQHFRLARLSITEAAIDNYDVKIDYLYSTSITHKNHHFNERKTISGTSKICENDQNITTVDLEHPDEIEITLKFKRKRSQSFLDQSDNTKFQNTEDHNQKKSLEQHFLQSSDIQPKHEKSLDSDISTGDFSILRKKRKKVSENDLSSNKSQNIDQNVAKWQKQKTPEENQFQNAESVDFLLQFAEIAVQQLNNE